MSFWKPFYIIIIDFVKTMLETLNYDNILLIIKKFNKIIVLIPSRSIY